jgi:hypothetical protein
MLEFTEASFDAVAQFVQGMIIVPQLFSVGAPGNDRLPAPDVCSGPAGSTRRIFPSTPLVSVEDAGRAEQELG